MSEYVDKKTELRTFLKETTPDYCLLENNENQINKIYDFLRSDKKLLLVSGFTGSGKTKVVNFSVTGIRPEVLLLHYSCLESTTIEDLFLSFFETFKQLVLKGRILQPKDKADNFTQRINSYFASIDGPILIELDSFDAIVKENKDAIVNFVNHISGFSNVKLIIVSRNFEEGIFDTNLCESVSILPLSQKIYEKYLKQNGLKLSSVLTNEFYKLSKGYYRTILLSLNIMSLRRLTLINFLEMYSKSYMSFSEFVIKEAIALVDPVSIHLFRLLTIMRIPIHIKLLNMIRMYDSERVKFFVDNAILSQEGEYIYLKECFRSYLEPKIPDNVRTKLHKACVDLYNTQLPLKPSERDLVLSRQTMRNEIEYHSLFLPKKIDLNAYEQMQKAHEAKSVKSEPEIKEQTVQPVSEPVTQSEKEEKINSIAFVVPDDEVLDNIADSIKGYIESGEENSRLEQISGGMSLRGLMESAMQQEREYNYKRAVMLYQQALTKTNDDDFYTFLPTIYTRLAQDYKNLSQWYEALEYYTQAQDFYQNVYNTEKAAEVKLEMANIYYVIYKNDNAKFILSELEKQESLSNDLKIRVNIALAKLTDDVLEEYAYYKKSLPLIEVGMNKALVSELYYKFATVCDETDDIETAVAYYQKCAEVDSNPKNNPYLSKSLSNMAELYDETGSQKLAIRYYQESVEICLLSKNYDELYYSYLRLGEIYSVSDRQRAVESFDNAIKYAKLSNEPFGMATSYSKVGDFYLNIKDYDKAYKYYNEALAVAKVSLSAENSQKIEQRLIDLQKHLSAKDYEQLRKKYAK